MRRIFGCTATYTLVQSTPHGKEAVRRRKIGAPPEGPGRLVLFRLLSLGPSMAKERLSTGAQSPGLIVGLVHAAVRADTLSHEKDAVMHPTPTPTLALRAKDAAKALGISARHLWQLTNDGHIPCVRVGSGRRKTVLYPTELLRSWLTLNAHNEQCTEKASVP
jgi:excisionase family DNA binding protein